MYKSHTTVTAHLLEASQEHLPWVSMGDLQGKPLEGVAIWNHFVNRILELLVADSTHPQAALSLVGGQGRREEVAEVIVPHCGQTQVL